MAALARPTVLITGAAKRIGADIARAFGTNGWHVIIHYGSSVLEAEALADELPSAEAIHCDLFDSDGAVAMVKSQMQLPLAIRLVPPVKVLQRLQLVSMRVKPVKAPMPLPLVILLVPLVNLEEASY